MSSISSRSEQAYAKIVCVSWEDFQARIQEAYSEELKGSYPVFRGHASTEWRLASQWERQLAAWPKRRLEKSSTMRDRDHLLEKFLQDFKDLAVGLPGIRSRELEELDWWAVGRHYGLVTPLLDWTRSPYVAAFFALSGLAERLSPGLTTTGQIDPGAFLGGSEQSAAAIWALQIGDLIEEDPHVEILNTRVDIGHRQRAQRGLFTRLRHRNYFDLESYLQTLALEKPLLTQYLVPGSAIPRALTELRMMNITFATLFPDLEGAALQANFEAVALSLMALSVAEKDGGPSN